MVDQLEGALCAKCRVPPYVAWPLLAFVFKGSDGTEGRFVFGNLSFSQAFPGGEAVTR